MAFRVDISMCTRKRRTERLLTTTKLHESVTKKTKSYIITLHKSIIQEKSSNGEPKSITDGPCTFGPTQMPVWTVLDMPGEAGLKPEGPAIDRLQYIVNNVGVDPKGCLYRVFYYNDLLDAVQTRTIRERSAMRFAKWSFAKDLRSSFSRFFLSTDICDIW